MGSDERHSLMRLIASLARDADGPAVLFTEHDVDIVLAHADRILVMDAGSLVAQGPPNVIRADPVARAAYLGDAVREVAGER
jgi:branched-chain amino acid transport system ATP-binding protein